ncbi:MAG: exo-alpha-sialidase [Candidatus Eisenbacteria bacterium]|uniref:Exo-alpha-sialidase n=1 Tax=Eiseniibacteriota bacterium TaxID=2212470 RepID=A0A937X780_UNCEI|nr:exo-alpha-sialidase [Candidatus Eisenbacteria bacterium]
MHSIRALRLLPLLLLAGAALLGARGRGGPAVPVIVPLDARPLYPPTRLAWSAAHGLVALVTDGESRRPVLYRAGARGEDWRRWAELPLSAGEGDTELVLAGDEALIFGAREDRILIIRLALADAAPSAPSGFPPGVPRIDTLAAGAPIVSLAADASPPDSAGGPAVHLAYLVRPAGEEGRSILYRRSADGGATWAPPDTLAFGDVEGPALFARSERANIVDLCYRRNAFMTWRGSGDQGLFWRDERPIRLAAARGSHNAVARRDNQVLVICENELHQVAGSTSLNHGYNWERAIAVAREARHLRMPALDCGGGLFWVAYSAGDSMVVLRSASDTALPSQWHGGINVAAVCTQGRPDVVALPDSTAGLLYGTPSGEVYFARVRQPARP